MKRISSFWIVLFLAGITTLAGCFHDNFWIRGSGPIRTQERLLNSFDKVILEMSANVYIQQGDVQEVLIEAQENLHQVIETDISGGVLKIRTRGNIMSHDGINIFITTPEITGLRITGSGDIVANNSIFTSVMELIILGSGDIRVQDLDANNVYSEIIGSGDIYVAGEKEATQHHIQIEGSGSVHAFDLKADEVDVKITGSGDARVHAVSNLDIEILGSGDVYYIGFPVINQRVVGSGRLYNSN